MFIQHKKKQNKRQHMCVCIYSARLSLVSLCQFPNILCFQTLTDDFGLLQTGTAQVTTAIQTHMLNMSNN